MPYPFYSNNQYYMQDLQSMRDKIDRQMQQMQQLNQNQMQMQQPVPQIHQSFQLTPQSNISEIQAKYVTDINEVKNTFVMSLGIFLNKELNTLWIKNTNGEIRTFSLNEIIEQDPKDIEIQNLKNEIERMKGMINYESDVNTSNNDGTVEIKNAPKLSNRKQSNAK